MVTSKSRTLDSLFIENKKSELVISELRDSLNNVEQELIIISNKKSEVKRETFTVSNSFSKSVTILNNNLKCIEL